MQKTALLGLIILIASCKKQVSDLSGNVDPIKEKVLSLDSYQGLIGLKKGEVKSLLGFLDHASVADNKLIADKIKSLSAGYDQGAPKTEGAERPTIVTDDPEMLQIITVNNSNYTSADGFLELSPFGFNYNWTVLKQITGFYKVLSKENCQVIDLGAGHDQDSRYSIYSITHMSSYIGGYAPGISWTENYNHQEYNIGGFHAYLSTGGILAALGFNLERSSDMYVNVSWIYASGGTKAF